MLSAFLGFSRLYVFSAAGLFAILLALMLSARLLHKMKGRWFIAIAVLVLGLVGSFGGFLVYLHTVGSGHDAAIASATRESEQHRHADPAIWQPGIEDHFEADIYPSKAAAIRALGLRMAGPVRQAFGSEGSPKKIVLFRGNHDRDLLAEYARAVSRSLPGVESAIERESVAVEANEVGIRLDFGDITTATAPWPGGSASHVAAGTVQATVLGPDKDATVKVRFAEKPWVEDFPGFANADPDARIVLARSQGSCTSEAQANREAIGNACAELTELLATTEWRPKPRLFVRRVTSAELLGEGLVVDRFVQSFEGKAGRIWRQALLVDASSGNLARLISRKAAAMRAAKLIWTRMLVLAVGVLGLIALVYAFLNAATKGYYVWSLRTAGVIIALICVVSIVLSLAY